MAQCTIIYPGHYELIEELTNEQAGLLIKTIGRYHRGEDVSIDDPFLKGIWLGIRQDFTKQKEKYEAVVERNKENGKKGGRPKTQPIPNNPSGFIETQSIPNNLKEKEKEKEKEKDKEKEKEINAAPSTNNTKLVRGSQSFAELFYSNPNISVEEFLTK